MLQLNLGRKAGLAIEFFQVAQQIDMPLDLGQRLQLGRELLQLLDLRSL